MQTDRSRAVQKDSGDGSFIEFFCIKNGAKSLLPGCVIASANKPAARTEIALVFGGVNVLFKLNVLAGLPTGLVAAFQLVSDNAVESGSAVGVLLTEAEDCLALCFS